ncbi:MAG: amidohydrolase [Cyanobacteria bacterium SZAS LIN-3]|nr:amidohydrolase [Cyanobacteria bacterium SZAS LIN-3]
MAPGFGQYEKAIAEGMTSGTFEQFNKGLEDLDELRLAVMDEHGIDRCVLSQTSPGLQRETDGKLAVGRAIEANDFLAAAVARHPQRFAGFAHLALQDVEAATAELDRCVNKLGFKGAMINGHTNGSYLDEAQYLPFWQHVASLDVPIYIHPADHFDRPHMYKDHPELSGPVWGWGVETGAHALRLIFSGLFDRLPNLKIILGHMGEMLPFMLWRIDSRAVIVKLPVALKKEPSQYIRDNFFVTTSGVCDPAPLQCAIDALGDDNVLFSIDYPYESTAIAADFINNAPVSETTRAKICHENARRVLKL